MQKNHMFHLSHIKDHEARITFYQKSMAPGLPRFHVISTMLLASWTKLLRQNRKSIFQSKNTSPPPKSMLLAKF